MSKADSLPAGSRAPAGPRRLPTARQVGFSLFLVLLLLGLAFYLWWGLDYGGWFDNGVYAVTITLVGFGLAGMRLTSFRGQPSGA
jgi:Trk-type K+ transport system membrane component